MEVKGEKGDFQNLRSSVLLHWVYPHDKPKIRDGNVLTTVGSTGREGLLTFIYLYSPISLFHKSREEQERQGIGWRWEGDRSVRRRDGPSPRTWGEKEEPTSPRK